MRGKVLRNRDCTALIGITPAYAGKSTLTQNIRSIAAGITPAYAGKSGKIGEAVQRIMGSPPPMRGKGLWSLLY